MIDYLNEDIKKNIAGGIASALNSDEVKLHGIESIAYGSVTKVTFTADDREQAFIIQTPIDSFLHMVGKRPGSTFASNPDCFEVADEVEPTRKKHKPRAA